MAAINDRDLLLQAASARLVTVDQPANINIPGDGTLNGQPVVTVVNGALSAGGTENFFTTSTSNPSGGASGDAHYNSSTQTMWFNIGGTWTIGGTINANQITTGTLAAARIAAQSITVDKLLVNSLSAISPNAGAITGGTFNGTAIPDLVNANVTLLANGSLTGGTGAITALDYANISGVKPDANATQNFFTTSTSNPTGGAVGDAHWNSATSVMWFNTPAGWSRGGTINAGEITVGTLAAARIAANSITTDKLDVTELSAIVANLGNVNAGSITGSASINITGSARFRGATSSSDGSAAGVFNDTGTQTNGIISYSLTGNGSAVAGFAQTSGGGNGVYGVALGSADRGVRAQRIGSGTALSVSGPMTISSTGLVTNLYAARAATADQVNASNITGSIDADTFQGSIKSSFCRQISGNGGITTVPNTSVLSVRTTGSLFDTVKTRATGTIVYIENDASDAVRKTNIRDQDLGLDFLLSARAVTFERIDSPGRVVEGFLANQIASLVDREHNITAWKENSCMEMSQTAMISPIVKGVQEFYREFAELQSEVYQLRQQLNLKKVA